jgi:hypothetical protein
MGYPDSGGLTAQGRSRREKVRLQAAQMFAQDMGTRADRRAAAGEHQVGVIVAARLAGRRRRGPCVEGFGEETPANRTGSAGAARGGTGCRPGRLWLGYRSAVDAGPGRHAGHPAVRRLLLAAHDVIRCPGSRRDHRPAHHGARGRPPRRRRDRAVCRRARPHRPDRFPRSHDQRRHDGAGRRVPPPAGQPTRALAASATDGTGPVPAICPGAECPVLRPSIALLASGGQILVCVQHGLRRTSLTCHVSKTILTTYETDAHPCPDWHCPDWRRFPDVPQPVVPDKERFMAQQARPILVTGNHRQAANGCPPVRPRLRPSFCRLTPGSVHNGALCRGPHRHAHMLTGELGRLLARRVLVLPRRSVT